MEFNRKKCCKILTVAAVSVFSQATNAIPFAFEGRSLGMGGASVATADLATAPWANPAMLTNQRPSDDFSLLLGIGAFIRDNNDLVSDIDDFQSADQRRQDAANSGDSAAEAAAVLDMSNIVGGIGGKDLAVDVTGLAAMGIAFDTFAMAVSIRSDAIAAGTVTNLSCQVTTPGCDPNQVTDSNYNILNVEGVLATEFGVSFAKSFRVYDRKLSVGIKPKVIDLQALSYQESILTVDSIDSITNQENKTDLGTVTTVDIGLAYDINKSFRLGLNIGNLIEKDFDIGGQKLKYETTARLGAAYRNRFLTLAVDYDLIENDPLLADPNFSDLKTQYLAAGAEFNAFDFAQLRIGIAKNMANGISGDAKTTALTAGVGFWLGFNLDVAATYTEHSLGAFVQTGFRF
jgi:F plasmid transfer operon, TraF, protein